MSTILKALKQVDQTAPPEEIQSWPLEIDTKETVKARVEKIRLNRKVYLTIVLALIIVAAGLLAYSQKDLFQDKLSSGKTLAKNQLPSLAPSKKGPIYRVKIYPPASKQTARSPQKDTLPNMGNQRAGLKYEPKQTGVGKQPRILPKNPVHQNTNKNQNFIISSKTGSPPKPALSKSRISRSQMADPKKLVQKQGRTAVTSSTKKPKPPLKQISRSYRRLDDSKLRLQAIAWSDDAAQRIAVINNHVVREGESVEGFSVNQIRQDDIIVNDGTESWRLEFGLK